MKSVIILSLLALASALPTPQDTLVSRAKVGKAPAVKPPSKPAVPVPAPAPAKPKTSGVPPKLTVDECAQKTSCLACTKDAQCGFDPAALKCVKKAKAGAVASSLVTAANAASCPPLKQAAGVSTDAQINTGAKEALAKMSNHIFVGETTSTTSGRHTFSSWTAKNKDAGRCDTETKLCVFQLNNKVPKTIFDDRAGAYTKSDIETMCLTAIKLNLSANKGKKLGDGAFVVQNKFAHPVCIRHLTKEPGSCFPVDIHATTFKLGESCVAPLDKNKPIAGKTVEIAAR